MEKEGEKRTPEEKAPGGSENSLDMKAARESLGMSLDEISRVTRISASVLEAIEEGDFDRLPEPVYARSFIETYTRIIGIESEKILSRYNSYLEREEPFKGPEKPKKKSWFRSHLSGIIWCVVVVAVIFFFAYSSLYKDYESTPEAEKIQAVAKPEGSPVGEEHSPIEDVGKKVTRKVETVAVERTPETEDVHTEKEAVDEKSGEYEAPSTLSETSQDLAREEIAKEPHLLEITATELTWLKIIADGGEPSEVLLQPGETITREAEETFLLTVGNAKGVDITFDGKSLGLLGRHGEVILLTLPGDGDN